MSDYLKNLQKSLEDGVPFEQLSEKFNVTVDKAEIKAIRLNERTVSMSLEERCIQKDSKAYDVLMNEFVGEDYKSTNKEGLGIVEYGEFVAEKRLQAKIERKEYQRKLERFWKIIESRDADKYQLEIIEKQSTENSIDIWIDEEKTEHVIELLKKQIKLYDEELESICEELPHLRSINNG